MSGQRVKCIRYRENEKDGEGGCSKKELMLNNPKPELKSIILYTFIYCDRIVVLFLLSHGKSNEA